MKLYLFVADQQPTLEVLQRHGVKKPDEFSREKLGKLIVTAHKDCAVKVVETACFMEPHPPW